MKARSEVHGAVSIVNAIASGKGSALGISLKVIAEVEMKKGFETKIISQNTNDYSLVVSIINEIINRYSLPFSGAEITIHSEIPVGKGLKVLVLLVVLLLLQLVVHVGLSLMIKLYWISWCNLPLIQVYLLLVH